MHVIKQGTSGERRGLNDWQYHHWTATAATTNVQKRRFTTIANRWKDDHSYRETQREHGWTLECCIFLNYFRNSQNRVQGDLGRREIASRTSSYRGGIYEKNPRKMSTRDDFKKRQPDLVTVSHQEGMGNASIPPSGRFRHRPIDEQLRSQLRWQCRNWRQFYATLASSSSSTTWWEPQQWQEHQQWQDWHGWKE